jgi:phage protein U
MPLTPEDFGLSGYLTSPPAGTTPRVPPETSYASDLMMRWGEFKWGVPTSAPKYQRMMRTSEYRWTAVDLIGQLAALQYVGPGAETVTLAGLFWPHDVQTEETFADDFNDALKMMDNLRAASEDGKPRQLADSRGKVWGEFVMVRVEESHDLFWMNGIPKRISFTVQLRKATNNGRNPIV